MTTHLKRTTLRGVRFSRQNVGVRRDAGRGLWVGRETDRLLNRHVNDGLAHDPSLPQHRRLGHILRALRRGGIVLARCQVAGTLPWLCLKTNMDAVGTRGGEVVVVELKTTQHEHGVHASRLYDQPCSKQPTLSNGLPNTERTHHMLQVGFGVLCVKALVGSRTPVHGVVLMSYDSCAVVHPMPVKYASTAWFAGAASVPIAVPRPRRRAPTAKGRRARQSAAEAVDAACLPWPHADRRATEAARRGEYSLVAGAKHGGSHVVGVLLKGGVECGAVCVAKPILGMRVADRKLLRSRLLKSNAFIFGKSGKDRNTQRTFVLEPGRTGKWSLVELRSA